MQRLNQKKSWDQCEFQISDLSTAESLADFVLPACGERLSLFRNVIPKEGNIILLILNVSDLLAYQELRPYS